MMNYDVLNSVPRLLMCADLRPAQGDRFQPTGFADLGPAEYTRPDADGKTGVSMLLVESAQSMANRLEKTCLDGDGPEIDPALEGLPYVAVTLKPTNEKMPSIRTSSLVEAHRLASPYVLKTKADGTTFGDKIAAEMSYTSKGPLDWKKIYATLLRYDPNSLIHGVFLSLIGDGRVRVQRAVTGFIEAENVKQVISGGVKNSAVDPKGEIQVEGTEGGEKGVYSNVPYSRVEYVAENIRAYFNLDLALIRGYGLPEAPTQLITALSLLKIRRFLSTQLRLRTACNFDLKADARATNLEDYTLPSEDELLPEVQRLIQASREFFANPAVTELETPVKLVSAKEKEKAAGAQG
jgi:CRISPR-associated protein Csb1